MKRYWQRFQKHKLSVLLNTFTSAIIGIWVICSVVMLLLSPEYVEFLYKQSWFPIDQYGWTTSQRIARAHLALDYLKTHTFEVEKYYLLNFSPSEHVHMQDVRWLIQSVYRIWIFCSVLLLGLFITHIRRKSLQEFSKLWKRAVITTVLLFGSIGIIATVAWNFFFTLFHQLLFTPGTWSFPQTTTLIRLFPELFWQVTTASVFLGIIFLHLIVLLILRIITRIQQRRDTFPTIE